MLATLPLPSHSPPSNTSQAAALPTSTSTSTLQIFFKRKCHIYSIIYIFLNHLTFNTVLPCFILFFVSLMFLSVVFLPPFFPHEPGGFYHVILHNVAASGNACALLQYNCLLSRSCSSSLHYDRKYIGKCDGHQKTGLEVGPHHLPIRAHGTRHVRTHFLLYVLSILSVFTGVMLKTIMPVMFILVFINQSLEH